MADDDSPRSETSRSELIKGLGCLLVFALPFAGVGVGATAWSAYDIWRWHSTQSWVATPATLLTADLQRTNSDDGVSYKAAATYRYKYGGQGFISEQVALGNGSDNIGNYQKDRAAELKAALRAGGRLTCFVNPNDPSQALLFRDLRPGMLAFKGVFALLFGGIGFGLLFAGGLGVKIGKRRGALMKQYPGEPWRWRDEWLAPRIRSTLGREAIGIGIFATIWNLISWPAFIAALTRDDIGWGPIAIIALFPLVGTGMASWATYIWLIGRKWGASEFEMAAVPGVLGGPLAGMIYAPGGIQAVDGFLVRLVCQKRVTRHTGGERRTETVTLWERETHLARDLSTGDSRTLIPVQFLIPFDLPSSSDDVTWKLEVRAATPGIDYRTEFELPVFKTETSSPSAVVDGEADSLTASGQDGAPREFATLVRSLRAVAEEVLPDRRRLRFPMARNRGLSAMMLAFTLGWLGICAGLFASDAPRAFPWVFSAFGALLVYGAVVICFRSTVLEYDRRGVTYSHRYFGIGRRRDVSRQQIKQLMAEKSGTTYNGRAYRRVVLRTIDGSKTTLVSEIAHEQDARQLAWDVARVLELDQGTSRGADRGALDSDLPAEFREPAPTSAE